MLSVAASERGRTERANALPDEWREHRVVRVEAETGDVRSIHLVPAEGGEIADFVAGQYIPLRVHPPGVNRPVARTYTVSSAPGEPTLRITVKRIAANGSQPEGLVPNYLHDRLEVGALLQIKAPRGDFTLNPHERRPAVLLGGGIGVTPLISMLHQVVREGLRTGYYRPLTFIQAARSVADLALYAEGRSLAAKAAGAIRVIPFVERSTPEQREADTDLVEGRVGAAVLEAALPPSEPDFYLCGPPPFMQGLYDLLRSCSVRDEQIFAEAFGPARLMRRTG